MKNLYLYIFCITFFVFCSPLGAGGQSLSTDKNAVVRSKLRIATTTDADASDPTKAVINIQYMDGLGRPLQTIGYKQSPLQNDIVSGAVTYDNYGRVNQAVLPVPASTGTGAYQTNPISTAQSFYADTYPYKQTTVYDNSPLNRAREQYGEGQTWRTATKNTKMYNESAGTDVRYYYLDANNNIVLNGAFPANSIFKTRIVDEQGHTTISYNDLQGRLVQKQIQDATGYITTYYIYDGSSRIKAVIQPEGYELNQSINYNSTEWDQWVFFYVYDYRSQLIEKKVPGAGVEYFVYDKWDRLVWTQTALQREQSKWTFKKYDAYNRLIMSGEKAEARTRQQLQTEADNWTGDRYESRVTGGDIYYSYSNAYPQVFDTNEIREVFYFSFYDNWRPNDMLFDGANAYHVLHTSSTGMATGGRTRNSENGNWLVYVNYYDNKNRIIQTYTHNLYGNVERTDFKYNFAGEAIEIRYLMRDANNAAIIQLERFDYDHAGRKTAYKLGMNAVGETVATYEHDEIGRQKTKKFYPDRQYQQASTPEYINRPPNPSANTEDLASKAVILNPGTSIDAVDINTYIANIGQGASNVVVQGLQTINFGYHLRGMLNCVNCTNNQPALDADQNDFFTNKLEFETANWYDGNIGKETWTSKANSGTNRSYTHNYDPAKRVTSSTYAGGMYSNENFSFSIGAYDKNGNIKTLNRSGATSLSGGVPTAFGPIDQMTYFYTGNRLTGVTDAISGNEDVGDFRDNGNNSDYTYWNDGSLKSDGNKGVNLINYDSYLNKPKEINYGDGRWIRFYYNGGGTKIKQTNSNGEEFHYTNKSIFQLKESITSLYQIRHDEGRIVPKNGGGFIYEFNYSDHLGNLRLSFREADGIPDNGVFPAPIVTQENSYFPFGLQHKGTDYYTASPSQNLHQYNGKEKIDMFNLGWSDYGFRSMDLQTARFISVDPLTTKFPELTNYQYASNNPITNVDLDGLEGGRSNMLTPGQQESIKKTFRSIRNEVDKANSRATTLIHIERIIKKEEPSRWSKMATYIHSYVKQFGGYSDANDASVLTQGKNLDGSSATVGETVAAGAGIFLPLIAGSQFMKLFKESGEIEAKIFSKQPKSETFNFSVKDGAIQGLDEGWYDFTISNSGELKIGAGHYGMANEATSVKGAGQIYINSKGKINTVNNNSGHYKPTKEELINQAKLLLNSGLTDDLDVVLYR